MATDRVEFVPWDHITAAGLETSTYNQGTKEQTHHKRKWKLVYYDDHHPGGVISKLGASFGSRLIIAGHGAPDHPNIYASHDDNVGISYEVVVDRLLEHGLKKYYVGTIGCDVCSSAVGNQPFAKLLAKELRRRGFKMTCVIGYKGALRPSYRDRDDQLGGEHKYFHRAVRLQDNTIVKSSQAYERFYGF